MKLIQNVNAECSGPCMATKKGDEVFICSVCGPSHKAYKLLGVKFKLIDTWGFEDDSSAFLHTKRRDS